MKKLLTEKRLCELAGLTEADTRSLYQTRLDKEERLKAARKRGRHHAEKEFFGSDGDPLVTTDVPDSRLVSPPPGFDPDVDPNATQKLTPDQIAQIQKDIPVEANRPVAMELYLSLIEPNYTDDELEILVNQHEDVSDALAQLIGWFHPAFHDSRGEPTYDNPSRHAVRVAQEFAEAGMDPVDKAAEFIARVEKYMYEEAKAEFGKNIASRKPARNVKVGRSATPGTPEYDYLQQFFKKDAAAKAQGDAPTAPRFKK
tara:strand:+ start:703 stop:1473 length:771 start_codon:yes stop_codon:yes gene_type:complete